MADSVHAAPTLRHCREDRPNAFQRFLEDFLGAPVVFEFPKGHPGHPIDRRTLESFEAFAINFFTSFCSSGEPFIEGGQKNDREFPANFKVSQDRGVEVVVGHDEDSIPMILARFCSTFLPWERLRD
jgi:hypothetical protein